MLEIFYDKPEKKKIKKKIKLNLKKKNRTIQIVKLHMSL